MDEIRINNDGHGNNDNTDIGYSYMQDYEYVL